MKKCSGCKQKKPVTDFNKNRSEKDGLQDRCRVCQSKAVKKSMQKPGAKRKHQDYQNKWRKGKGRLKTKIVRKKTLLKTRYGLTLEEYFLMYEAQDGVCPICKRVMLLEKVTVDHNHQTGKIRGLLCNQCNRGVGLLRDSVTLLRNAADYLEKTDG